MHHRHLPRIVSVLTVTAAAILLAGCERAGEPTVIETPNIQWDPAAPSAGSDPFVETAHAWMIGWALAQNHADFTLEQFTSTTTPTLVEQVYENFVTEYVGAEAPPRVYVGPRPAVVLDVEPIGGGTSADVLLCYPEAEWYIEERHPEPVVDRDAPGHVMTYSIITVDGTLRVSNVSQSSDECDPAGAAFGTFEPVPDIPDSINESDIRKPLTLNQD